jgi:hypothetical protein
MAAPERAAFDRYPEVPTLSKAAIYANLRNNFMKMTTFVKRGEHRIALQRWLRIIGN